MGKMTKIKTADPVHKYTRMYANKNDQDLGISKASNEMKQKTTP